MRVERVEKQHLHCLGAYHSAQVLRNAGGAPQGWDVVCRQQATRKSMREDDSTSEHDTGSHQGQAGGRGWPSGQREERTL